MKYKIKKINEIEIYYLKINKILIIILKYMI